MLKGSAFPCLPGKNKVTTGTFKRINAIRCYEGGDLDITYLGGATSTESFVIGEDMELYNVDSLTIASGMFSFSDKTTAQELIMAFQYKFGFGGFFNGRGVGVNTCIGNAQTDGTWNGHIAGSGSTMSPSLTASGLIGYELKWDATDVNGNVQISPRCSW